MKLIIKLKFVFFLGIINLISLYTYSQVITNKVENKEQIIHLDSLSQLNLANYIYIYEDTTRGLSIKEVGYRKYSKRFVPFSQNKNFKQRYFYWAKINIDPGKSNDNKILIRLRGSDYINLYIPTEENKFQLKKIGYLVPSSENDEISNFSNTVLIEFKKERLDQLNIRTLYIKFYSISGTPKFYLDIIDVTGGLKIITQELDESKKEQFQNGIFHGILLFIFLFGIFLFISQKNIDNLYYSLYVFGISVFLMSFNGLLSEYVLFNHRQYDFLAGNLFSFMALIFYNLFLKNVLGDNFDKKWLRWSVNFLTGSMILLMLLAFLLMALSENTRLYKQIILPVTFVLFVVYLVVNIRLLFIEDKVSRMIAIGTLVLFSALFYLSLGLFLGFPFKDQVIKSGVLIQVLVFAFILIYKIKRSDDLKKQAQSDLIFQLQENQKLQTKVNHELDQKVKERTIQITERNKELQQRNEEIKLQRDEILNKSELLEQQNEEIKTQSELVNEQNIKISDSIQYAKKIQFAVLPHQAYIDEILPENFILFKPRDIVSGDFYWVKQISDFIVIAAADCTGHGVPGAILSMLGISFLNEIVQKREITQAKQVLNELRKQIKQVLRQTGKKGEADDGMDISLCVLETKTKNLQYAGANNPLYLIQSDELIEIKADRMPIGYYPNEKPTFTNHEIQLNDGDIFYLFSDGFSDQFGGKKGFKYKAQNFQKILQENHNKPMIIQKGILELELKNWMSGYEQTDDILVMGVRV